MFPSEAWSNEEEAQLLEIWQILTKVPWVFTNQTEYVKYIEIRYHCDNMYVYIMHTVIHNILCNILYINHK